jgi:hypothetical protein
MHMVHIHEYYGSIRVLLRCGSLRGVLALLVLNLEA